MKTHDLVVIGAGPGGYVGAIRAAQLGMNVGCVEAEPLLGGTCLRIGCIPSKVLLESTALYAAARDSFAEHGLRLSGLEVDLTALQQRKDRIVATLARGVEGLFRKNGVTRYQGRARLAGPGRVVVEGPSGTEELHARHVLIATGSQPATLPGVKPDGVLVATSTEALSWQQVPGHLVVIGAGYIGLELGCVWQRLGSKVTVLEYLDRILPGTDGEIAAEALKLLTRQGLVFHLSSRITGVRTANGRCVIEREGAEPLEADRVLLAVGRVPYTQGLGLESVGLQPDEKGRLSVDARFATKAPGVFAVGDVIGGPMLAHKAQHEAVACVEGIAGGVCEVNYNAIPGICYTEPEVAGVGKTEEDLIAAGVKYKKGVVQFRSNGRARALGQIEGKVKILADERTDRVLGVHIIGPRAGDLIAEAAVAIEFGASSEDLARCCHAHPTLAELIKEAALAVDGRAIHA
jgi:dihydrolipoamide dehydrogenase